MNKLDQLLKLLSLMEEKDTPATACLKERAVVVFTDERGVFFGYTDADATGNVKLRNARNCHYWAANKGDRQNGFLGLAAKGPAEGSKISIAADIELTGVTCIAECTEEAAKRWENSTWIA